MFQSPKNTYMDPVGLTVRRPVVGMGFLHRAHANETLQVRPKPRLRAKDIVGFLFGQREREHSLPVAPPKCRVLIEVTSPSGRPAVEIAFEEAGH